jgi:hypothetical protein
VGTHHPRRTGATAPPVPDSVPVALPRPPASNGKLMLGWMEQTDSNGGHLTEEEREVLEAWKAEARLHLMEASRAYNEWFVNVGAAQAEFTRIKQTRYRNGTWTTRTIKLARPRGARPAALQQRGARRRGAGRPAASRRRASTSRDDGSSDSDEPGPAGPQPDVVALTRAHLTYAIDGFTAATS